MMQMERAGGTRCMRLHAIYEAGIKISLGSSSPSFIGRAPDRFQLVFLLPTFFFSYDSDSLCEDNTIRILFVERTAEPVLGFELCGYFVQSNFVGPLKSRIISHSLHKTIKSYL